MASKAKPYTDYPEQYFKILEHFQSSNDSISFSMTARQVQGTRRSFYRFLSALTSSISSNPIYIQSLLNVSRDLILCLRPVDARGEERADLLIELNPICDRVISPTSFPPPGRAQASKEPSTFDKTLVDKQQDVEHSNILEQITGKDKARE